MKSSFQKVLKIWQSLIDSQNICNSGLLINLFLLVFKINNHVAHFIGVVVKYGYASKLFVSTVFEEVPVGSISTGVVTISYCS